MTKQQPNWGEKFDKRFAPEIWFGTKLDVVTTDEEAREEVKDYISKEIIKPLIDDIPDEVNYNPDELGRNQPTLQQHLKSKWLGEEST